MAEVDRSTGEKGLEYEDFTLFTVLFACGNPYCCHLSAGGHARRQQHG
jgi:hypothetical protein